MQMQVWSWTETNWSLILMLIIGSGLLAWLGDVIGMKFGKRRVSLFKLRPKTAGHVITGLTGMAITLATVLILASFSDNVRTTLFSLKYVQRQLTESRVNLIKSQEERDELERSIETLKNEIADTSKLLEQMKEGTIVVRSREVLSQAVIPTDSSSSEITKIIQDAKLQAAENIAERFGMPSENIKVSVDDSSIDGVISASANSEERRYLRVSALHNTAAGAIVELECSSANSYLIFNEGETIYRRLADPAAKNFNAEEFLHQFLRELRFKAIRDGVSPDPATNNVGSLEGVKFFETVENLREKKLPVIVNGIATQNIYTEGPVSIRILVEE